LVVVLTDRHSPRLHLPHATREDAKRDATMGVRTERPLTFRGCVVATASNQRPMTWRVGSSHG
jgi:hypothetical protein